MAKQGLCSCNCCCIVVGVLGLLVLLASLCFLHFFPIIFDDMVEKQVILANNSTGFQEWADPPAPIFLEIYIWNWENPEAVVNGAKPNVTQRGPYVYREERPKINITDNGNRTLSYVSPQTFYFDRERSVGDPYVTTFTTLDVPYLTVVNQAQYMSILEKAELLVLILYYKSDIFVTKTVHDFIWGYQDKLLTEIKKFKPDLVPTDVFGIFANRNESNDGVYTVYTGENNSALTNTINKWKGTSLLDYWNSKQANMINGTDGTYNRPFITKDDTVYLFSSDICRSIFALYLEDTTVRGIPTLRFSLPPYLFANYTIYPENAAFCTPAFDNGTNCYPGGLLNVSNCQFGAPIFMSSPHFLYADQAVFDMIEGVHPVEDLHRTFFDLEPNTGGPLNVSKKLQVNAHLRSYDFGPHFKNVPEAYFPLAWINENGALAQDSADELKKELLIPYRIGRYGTWAAVGLGCALLLIPLMIFGIGLCRSRRPDSLSINENDTGSLLKGDT